MSNTISDKIYDDLLYNTSATVYDKIVEHIDKEGQDIENHKDAMDILNVNRDIILSSINIPRGLTTELLLQNTIMGISLKLINLLLQAKFMEHIKLFNKIFQMEKSNMADELKHELIDVFKEAAAQKVDSIEDTEKTIEEEETEEKEPFACNSNSNSSCNSNTSILIIIFLLVIVSLLYVYSSSSNPKKLKSTIK